MFPLNDVGVWVGYARVATMDVTESERLRAYPGDARGTRKRPAGRASSARDDQARDEGPWPSAHERRRPHAVDYLLIGEVDGVHHFIIAATRPRVVGEWLENG